MKRAFHSMLFGAILLAGVVSLPPVTQAHGCTMSDVAGKWGYTYTGTIILPTGAIPAAAVGRFTIDAVGNLSGTQTRSVGGGVGEETIKGTGTVNADCSATFKVDVYDGAGNLVRSAVLASMFVDGAAELRAIFASLVLPNGASLPTVITVNAKKVASSDQQN